MDTKRKAKMAADGVILLCGTGLLVWIYSRSPDTGWKLGIGIILLLSMAGAAIDLLLLRAGKKPVQNIHAPGDDMPVRQLILLDEQDKPIKSWDMWGKTAFILGRRNQEAEVDIDLEDCQYGAFIDPQHAALNYCLDSWYVEDLGSQNGVRIKKVEDGTCYKVLNRPCRVGAGDVIYIANTRLLLT